MAIQAGDAVRVKSRAVTADDRKSYRYFEHLAGLEGKVQSVYSPDEVALEVRLTTLPGTTLDVQLEANRRMREKFLANISEEARSQLTPEEADFQTHFVVLVKSGDLEKV